MRKLSTAATTLSLAVALVALDAAPRLAHAADAVRVGKAVASAFTFTPVDIGIKHGIFAKYGLAVKGIAFTGDAKLQQGLTSGSVEFGLGSGPGMAFAVKGVPARAVAAYFGAPINISVIVAAKSPIKKVADLKGKVMAVSTVGSLTAWLTQRISIHEGWGPNGIKIVATGGGPAMYSAIVSGAVDAGMGSYESALTLQEQRRAHPLVTMDKFVPRFITHVIFARKTLIDQKPAEVESFVKGFFATLQWMRDHREQTIADVIEVLHESKAVMTGAYDREMPLMSKDGRFDPVALKTIKESWVARGTLPKEPNDNQFLTRKFVPVKIASTGAK